MYESIMQYQRVNGYAPTIRGDMQDGRGGIDFKCLCTSENIRRKGYIARKMDASRAIAIL